MSVKPFVPILSRFLSGFLLSLLCCGSLFAQDPYQMADFAKTGENQIFSISPGDDKEALTRDGDGQTWDFSDFIPEDQITLRSMEPPQAGPSFSEWSLLYDRDKTDFAQSVPDMIAWPYSFTDLTAIYYLGNDSTPFTRVAGLGVFNYRTIKEPFKVEFETSGAPMEFRSRWAKNLPIPSVSIP